MKRVRATTYGYVEVNKNTMQHIRFPNVFALGDCTNAPCSKTGAAIRKQAPVVVQNVMAVINKEQIKGNTPAIAPAPFRPNMVN